MTSKGVVTERRELSTDKGRSCNKSVAKGICARARSKQVSYAIVGIAKHLASPIARSNAQSYTNTSAGRARPELVETRPEAPAKTYGFHRQRGTAEGTGGSQRGIKVCKRGSEVSTMGKKAHSDGQHEVSQVISQAKQLCPLRPPNGAQPVGRRVGETFPTPPPSRNCVCEMSVEEA